MGCFGVLFVLGFGMGFFEFVFGFLLAVYSNLAEVTELTGSIYGDI